MLLKAAINGRRAQGEHPAIPITPGQLADEAAMAVAAGAGAIHVHPRDSNGQESLAAKDIAVTLNAIRAACPATPIGVSTGAWIVPEIALRLALINEWKVLPDFAGVNFHEPGAVQTCRLLLEKGVGFEAGSGMPKQRISFSGAACRADVCVFLSSPHKNPEIPKVGWTKSRRFCKVLLGGASCTVSGHRRGSLSLASRRGYDTRIGFEDTLALPDGTQAEKNSELVTAARQLIERCL